VLIPKDFKVFRKNTCRSEDSKGVKGAIFVQESNWGGPEDFE
jgi:hypothetical protein